MPHQFSLAKLVRRRRTFIAVFVLLITATTVTPAVAAEAGPSIAIHQYGTLIYTPGAGFPSRTTLDYKATINGMSRTAKVTTSSSGTFAQAFWIPNNTNGVLTITAATGSKTTTASKTIGNVAPTTTVKPATTTTVKPATTTQAPPATTSTTAKPVTTTTTLAPNTGVKPLGPTGNWNLVFGDEFNGTAIDRSKFPECHWATRPGCAGQTEKELQAYRPGNVTVSGGAAHLTAKRESVNVPELGKTLPYTSGSIATGPWVDTPSTFKFKYGYVESRIKVAAGAGLWSSLWLEQANLVWPPEIDIMEAPNFESTKLYSNIHYKTSSGRDQSIQSHTGPNWSADYHVFGLEWSASSLKWYIDGKLVRTYSDASKIPSSEMYVIANLSVGGWAETPPSSTKFPASMSLDYIRVWQR